MENKKLEEWLILNRDSEGLSELFYELSERMKAHRIDILNTVRKGDDAQRAVGAYDELESLSKYLTKPLEPT